MDIVSPRPIPFSIPAMFVLPEKLFQAMAHTISHPRDLISSTHSLHISVPMPFPLYFGDTDTESRMPVRRDDSTASLSGQSGSPSTSGSSSGPKTLQIAKPATSPSSTATMQNWSSDPMASRKSPSSR